jgi:hypothetical protein
MASFLFQLGKDILIGSITGLYYLGRYIYYGREPTAEEKIDRILIEMANLKKILNEKDAKEESQTTEARSEARSEARNGSEGDASSGPRDQDSGSSETSGIKSSQLDQCPKFAQSS